MKGARVTLHILATLPDSMAQREQLLADLLDILPKGEPRQHVRVLLAHNTEFQRSLAAAQAELPLQFPPSTSTKGAA